jgi:hypothetical protein
VKRISADSKLSWAWLAAGTRNVKATRARISTKVMRVFNE